MSIQQEYLDLKQWLERNGGRAARNDGSLFLTDVSEAMKSICRHGKGIMNGLPV